MQAIVNATIEDNLRSDDEDGESLPRTAAADREFQRQGEIWIGREKLKSYYGRSAGHIAELALARVAMITPLDLGKSSL